MSSHTGIRVSSLLRATFAAAVLLLLAAWLYSLRSALQTQLTFDDAYMFYRYALHMRAGVGMSWNMDGVHTYGMTSVLWQMVVFVASWLPLSASATLVAASMACSAGALLAMAWAVSKNAGAGMQAGYVPMAAPLLLIVLPLGLLHHHAMPLFATNATTGMETMLAALLCALYVGFLLRWLRGKDRAWPVVVAGVLLTLSRPESALVVVLLLCAARWMQGSPRTIPLQRIGLMLLAYGAAMALVLVACKLYFGTALPLSFSMKSEHGYVGYAGNWHPVEKAMDAFRELRVYLLLLALCVSAQTWRVVLVCGGALLAVFAYLCSVQQIMGFASRYYVPYMPLVIVPALLSLASVRWSQWRQQWALRAAGFGAVLVLTAAPLTVAFAQRVDQMLIERRTAYAPVQCTIAAQQPLPLIGYLDSMHAISDELARPLPQITIAASEVGLLGADAPRTTIIDLAGLNDPAIALHGFSMPALLQRRPDVIWFPHTDYTWQRAQMFTDPALLAEYDVYAGALNYGLAVRKDSPYRTEINQQFVQLWQRLYPGQTMESYRVLAVHWSGAQYRLHG
jgi:hypothetical protein